MKHFCTKCGYTWTCTPHPGHGCSKQDMTCPPCSDPNYKPVDVFSKDWLEKTYFDWHYFGEGRL